MAKPVRIEVTREPDGYHIAARYANDVVKHIRALPSWIGYLRAVGWATIPRKVS